MNPPFTPVWVGMIDIKLWSLIYHVFFNLTRDVMSLDEFICYMCVMIFLVAATTVSSWATLCPLTVHNIQLYNMRTWWSQTEWNDDDDGDNDDDEDGDDCAKSRNDVSFLWDECNERQDGSHHTFNSLHSEPPQVCFQNGLFHVTVFPPLIN